MKILMISPKFHPHLGGVERHLLELCSELLSRGHEITILTDRYDSALAGEAFVAVPKGVVKVVRLPLMNISFRSVFSKEFWATWRVSARVIARANLVHCHDFSVFIYWYFPVRWLFPLKPVYVTFHGWEGVCPPTKRTILFRKITTLFTCGNICIGDYISKWYGTKPTFVSYGGVQPPKQYSAELEFDAGFIGRLSNDTGILIYLDALKILRERGVYLQVLVCGDGPLRHVCEAFVQANNLQVKFLGWVQEPRQYIAQCKYALTSGYLSILDAMIMGRIVFSVYDNALKEDYLKMLPNNEEVMFIACSSNELASQVEKCLGNPTLQLQMEDQAKSWSRQQTWDNVANLYEDLWQHV